MRILAVGDVVADPGLDRIRRSLPAVKREHNIDFCIINGENSAGGKGITRAAYDSLLSYGADVITTGNHVWNNYQIYDMFDDGLSIIRPANYPPSAAGDGYIEVDMGKHKVCVINLLGRASMDAVDCPFRTADSIIKNTDADIILVDFHAEATSEKAALGYYLDGRVSAVFGTHTHVLTADERILPKGTGFITDIGMTGVIDSVIGMKTEASVARFVNKIPNKYEPASGETMLCGCIFDIDDNGRCLSVERIVVK